jgi:hypothetical protein
MLPVEPVAHKRIVRLTIDQVLNSVGDLIAEEVEILLRQDYGQDAFERAPLPLSSPSEGSIFVESIWVASDAIAHAAGQYVLENFEAITGCGASATRACADEYVLGLAPRAYRAPLSAAEQTSLLTVMDETLATDASLPEAVRYAVYAVFSAPQFLYRREFGQDVTLDEALAPHELASQLAYFLTDGPPDAALTADVEQGGFATREAWSEQTDRLLATPAAQTNIASALYAYFGFQGAQSTVIDTTLASDFSEALRASMLGEVRRVAERSMHSGTVDDLLTSRSSFLDQALADFYGAQFPPDGEALDEAGFAWTELPSGRAGLLTSGAFLLNASRPDTYSVPYRGILVMGMMACGSPPAIPEGPDHEDMLLPDATQRERAEYRMSTQPCSGCHSYLDPYGLALEDFDFIGKAREFDTDGSPIDSSATLVDGTSIAGAEELAAQLTMNDAFASCLARHWLAYALSEAPVGAINECTVQDIMASFSGSPRQLPDLIRAVAVSEPFILRLGAE